MNSNILNQKWTTVLLGSLFFCGCQGQVSRPLQSTVPLIAKVSGAESIVVKKTDDKVVVLAGGIPTARSLYGELQKVDSSGKLSPILNKKRETNAVLMNDSMIVASGDYEGIYFPHLNKLAHCHLIAFSKSDSDQSVRCLSEKRVGTYDHRFAYSSFAEGHDKLGFVLKDSSVYFANSNQLLRWNQKTNSTELLFTLDLNQGIRIADVYIHSEKSNVCILIPGPLDNTGKIICGDPDQKNWAALKLEGDLIHSKVFQLNPNQIITSKYVIHLDDLSIHPRTFQGVTGFLPQGPLKVLRTANGGAFGINRHGILVQINPDGSTILMDKSRHWEKLIGRETYGWAIANNSIKRIQLKDAVIENEDFFDKINLKTIDIASHTTGDFIRLESENSDSVYLNSKTGEILPQKVVEASKVSRPHLHQIIHLKTQDPSPNNTDETSHTNTENASQDSSAHADNASQANEVHSDNTAHADNVSHTNEVHTDNTAQIGYVSQADNVDRVESLDHSGNSDPAGNTAHTIDTEKTENTNKQIISME